MPFLRSLACLAVLWFAGCAEVPGEAAQNEPEPSSTGDGEAGLPDTASQSDSRSDSSSEPPAKGGFRVLETGWNSYAETDGFDGRVLRDQASWEAFWAEHRSGHYNGQGESEPGEPPAVDFASELPIVVLQGYKPSGGYSIEVTDVTARGDGLAVLYATTAPGDRCAVTWAISHPFQIVAVKAAVDVPVEFEPVEERVREC